RASTGDEPRRISHSPVATLPRPPMRHLSRQFALLFAAFVFTAPLIAQTPRQVPLAVPRSGSATFTADDALDINALAVSDLTENGRYLAVLSVVRRDQYGQDFRRDGDPTYTRGVPTGVVIVDTKTGAQQQVFADK